MPSDTPATTPDNNESSIPSFIYQLTHAERNQSLSAGKDLLKEFNEQQFTKFDQAAPSKH